MENLSLKEFSTTQKTQAKITVLTADYTSCGQRPFNLTEGFLIPVPNRTKEMKRETGLMHHMTFNKRQVLSWPLADGVAVWTYHYKHLKEKMQLSTSGTEQG